MPYIWRCLMERGQAYGIEKAVLTKERLVRMEKQNASFFIP